MHMEMGVQNEQKIKQNSNITTNSVNAINNFQGRNCNANYQPARKDFTRYPIDLKNYQYASICTNCGQRWSHNHRQICPANGKVTIVVIPGILQVNVETRKSPKHKHKPTQTNINR